MAVRAGGEEGDIRGIAVPRGLGRERAVLAGVDSDRGLHSECAGAWGLEALLSARLHRCVGSPARLGAPQRARGCGGSKTMFQAPQARRLPARGSV